MPASEKKTEAAASAELSGADLKSDDDPQPEDQGKTASATLSGGTKITGPAEVISRLKNR